MANKSRETVYKQKEEKQFQEQYKSKAERYIPKAPVFANCLKAFLSGGFLCMAAEFLHKIWMSWGHLAEKDASAAVLVIVIGLTALVTGLGFYDDLGQKFGAGLAVPISGFANSVTSAAMDNRTEGWVLGTATNSF
ncbi:MAG: SpoVA/SpoVAEb family sporulation membrane protein, partial [Clostridiales bacterium]